MLSYNLVLVLVLIVIAVAAVVILRKKGLISWKRKGPGDGPELQQYKTHYFGPPEPSGGPFSLPKRKIGVDKARVQL